MTTLVSFIGNPEKLHAGPADGPSKTARGWMSEYRATDYRFEEGAFQARSLFFGWAALQYLRWSAAESRRQGLNPDRWLVIGTATSGWQMMAEVAIEADPSTLDAAAAWAERARAAVLGGGAEQSLLAEFEALFGRPLGTELRLRAASDDADSVFGCLHDNLDRGSRVILDVTHSYRTMPIHATIALGALKWIKDIEIADILYGGFVKRPSRDAPAPAVSLSGSARLAGATPHLAAVALTDDLEAAAECAVRLEVGSQPLQEALLGASVLESLLQVDEAESVLRSKRVASDDAWRTGTRMGEAAAILLRGAAGVSSPLPRADSDFLRAEAFLRRRDYLRALLLLSESIRRRAIDLLGLAKRANSKPDEISMVDAFGALQQERPTAFSKNRLSLLRRTRNQVVHADLPHPDVQVLLRDAGKLRSMLEGTIREARSSLFAHLG